MAIPPLPAMRAELVVLLLAVHRVAHATILTGCNETEIDLPQNSSEYSGRYVLLRLAGPTNLVVTTDEPTFSHPVGIISSDAGFYLEGYSGTDWSLFVRETQIRSYDESTTPPSTISHYYIRIVASWPGHEVVSLHYAGTDGDADFCTLVFGKSMYKNAPLVSTTHIYTPVDMTVQAPPVIAIVNHNNNLLVDVLTAIGQNAPNGTMEYRNPSADTFITIQTQKMYGFPINALSNILHNYYHLSHNLYEFDGLDYPPLLTGIHVDSGMPSVHATAPSPYYQENYTALDGLDDPNSQKVLQHLNLQRSASRLSMSIPVSDETSFIPIFGGATPHGLLDTEFVVGPAPMYEKVPPIKTDYNDCDSMVALPDFESNETRMLCMQFNANRVVRIDPDGTSTTIVSNVAVNACSPPHIQLVKSGHCAALIVCLFTQPTLNTWGTSITQISLEGLTGTPVIALLFGTSVIRPVIVAAYPTAGIGWCGTDTDTTHAVYYRMFDSFGTSTLRYINPVINYGNPIYPESSTNKLITAFFSTTPLDGINLETDSFNESFTESLDGDVLPSNTVYLTLFLCEEFNPNQHCTINLYSAEGAPPTSLGEMTAIYEDVPTTATFYDVVPNNDQATPMSLAHARINTSDTIVPSFTINQLDTDIIDTFLFFRGYGIIERCIIHDSTMYCAPPHTVSVERVPSTTDYVVYPQVIGPIVHLMAGTTAYQFNLASMIIVNATTPDLYCHNESFDEYADQSVQIRVLSLGGDPIYSKQQFSAFLLLHYGYLPMTMYVDWHTGAYTHVFRILGSTYIQSYTTTCSLPKSMLPTIAAYHYLYPQSYDWCDNLQLVGAGNESASPYLPNDGTLTPLQANELPSGPITIPSTNRDIYYSSTLHDGTGGGYCDGSIPPAHHGFGSFLSVYGGPQATRSSSLLSGVNMFCASRHSDLPIGTPVSMLLMETNTRVFWFDYPICYIASVNANADLLPFMDVPSNPCAASESCHHINLGHSVYGIGPTPIPPVCHYTTEYYDNHSSTCQPLTQCETDEYEVRTPQAGWDRLCQKTTPCLLGENYESVSPTPTTDRVCIPTTTCTSAYHVSVGATLTSDLVCRGLVSTCLPGQFLNLAAQIDANPGETNTVEQCSECVDGTTFNEECDRGRPYCLQHHSETSCNVINITWTCPNGSYLSTNDNGVGNLSEVVGHPIMYCKPCTSCTQEATSCTAVTDSGCSPVRSEDPPDVPMRCPPYQWSKPGNALAIASCEPWSECPHGWIKAEGTWSSDRFCATVGSEEYIYESCIGLFGSLILLIAARIWINHEPSASPDRSFQ